MRTLVNGLGCRDYGSLRVFDEFLEECGCPGMVTLELVAPGERQKPKGPGVVRIRVPSPNSERLRGALRLAIECIVWATRGLGADRVVNLSNYGLPCSPSSLLLLHNALTIGLEETDSSLQAKQALTLVAACCSTVCSVQTRHMARLLQGFCAKHGRHSLSPFVLTPRPELHNTQGMPNSHVGRLKFLYPCSRYPHKQVQFARDLFDTVERVFEKAGLSITLDGENSAHVTCIGVLPEEDLQARLRTTDALFFASTVESLGLPLVDALLLGKPAVLPDLPYAREIYGGAACYYAPLSKESATQAIQTLSSDLAAWKQMVDARRSRFLSESLPPREYYPALLRMLSDASTAKVI